MKRELKNDDWERGSKPQQNSYKSNPILIRKEQIRKSQKAFWIHCE